MERIDVEHTQLFSYQGLASSEDAAETTGVSTQLLFGLLKLLAALRVPSASSSIPSQAIWRWSWTLIKARSAAMESAREVESLWSAYSRHSRHSRQLVMSSPRVKLCFINVSQSRSPSCVSFLPDARSTNRTEGLRSFVGVSARKSTPISCCLLHSPANCGFGKRAMNQTRWGKRRNRIGAG